MRQLEFHVTKEEEETSAYIEFFLVNTSTPLNGKIVLIIRNISRDYDQATKIINHLLGSENQQLLLMLEDYDYLLKRIKNLKN